MNTGGVIHSEFDVNGNGEIAPLPSPPKKYTLEAEADKITNLPGFRSKSNVSTTNSTSTSSSSSLDELPYNQFSGYLNISSTKKIFYWFVERSSHQNNNDSEKSNDSDDEEQMDPLIFWTNGGPGCSGLIGFGSEHGPFVFSYSSSEDNDDDVQLIENPYSWNKLAHILYVEQPCGVGFSYFSSNEKRDDDESEKRDSSSDEDNDDEYDYNYSYDVGDEIASKDNLEILLAFYERFPHLEKNPLYLTSESYGGHYIPQLTKKILDYNSDNDEKNNDTSTSENKEEKTKPLLNLKGFAIGNPYVDPFLTYVTMYEKMYFDGLISYPLYKLWKSECTTKSDLLFFGNVTNKELLHKCSTLIGKMESQVAKGINPYALNYAVCLDTRASSTSSILKQQEQLHFRNQVIGIVDGKKSYNHRELQIQQEDYNPCKLDAFTYYLRKPQVLKAIHVETSETTGSQTEWKTCSRDIHYSYKDVQTSLIDFYTEIITEGVKSGLNMLIFSGDNDSICSTSSTQRWIYNLGDFKPYSDWAPWIYAGQYAGFVTHFNTSIVPMNSENLEMENHKTTTTKTTKRGTFTFATIHGAGHEAPSYKPQQSLQLLQKFLSGEW